MLVIENRPSYCSLQFNREYDCYRWKNLQTKDLSRIDRQIENLMKQINPLKSNLAAASQKEEEYKMKLDQADAIRERKIQELSDQFHAREYEYKEVSRSSENRRIFQFFTKHSQKFPNLKYFHRVRGSKFIYSYIGGVFYMQTDTAQCVLHVGLDSPFWDYKSCKTEFLWFYLIFFHF